MTGQASVQDSSTKPLLQEGYGPLPSSHMYYILLAQRVVQSRLAEEAKAQQKGIDKCLELR